MRFFWLAASYFLDELKAALDKYNNSGPIKVFSFGGIADGGQIGSV
jgi:hypothetical protein